MQLICYFHVSWCCLWTRHIRPLKLDYEFPVTWPVTFFQLIMRQLFHYSLFDYISFLYIMLGLRQSQIMESQFDHLFRCFTTEWERAHFVFIKNQRNLNCLQPLRNDLEHNDGTLKFSLFAWCYTPIAKITCWNHQSDATDILAIKHFDDVKV